MSLSTHEICKGCGEEVDVETCWCGDDLLAHGEWSNHSPVVMGCRCYMAARIIEWSLDEKAAYVGLSKQELEREFDAH